MDQAASRDAHVPAEAAASAPGRVVQRFYRWHAHFYDQTRWLILHRRRQAVAALDIRPDSQVLEVGCGTGLNFALSLARLDAGRGGRLVGLDFSADMLERARRRVRRAGWTNVELVQADATTMDLGRTFDRILLAYSLTMIPDPRAALTRARAHLEPDGVLVVLDFGRFGRWGPAGALMRAWLQANHVETTRPYAQVLRELFEQVEIEDWLGGYCFIARATRSPAHG